MIAKETNGMGGDQVVKIAPATPYELSTEDRAAEAAMRDLETRYRAVLECSHDGLLVADAGGQYVEANEAAAALLGFSPSELTRMSMDDLYARPVWSAEDRLRFVQEGRWDGVMSIRSRSGEPVPVNARLSLVQLHDRALYLTAWSPVNRTDPELTTLVGTSVQPSLLERGIGVLCMVLLLITLLIVAGTALAVYGGFRFPKLP